MRLRSQQSSQSTESSISLMSMRRLASLPCTRRRSEPPRRVVAAVRSHELAIQLHFVAAVPLRLAPPARSNVDILMAAKPRDGREVWLWLEVRSIETVRWDGRGGAGTHTAMVAIVDVPLTSPDCRRWHVSVVMPPPRAHPAARSVPPASNGRRSDASRAEATARRSVWALLLRRLSSRANWRLSRHRAETRASISCFRSGMSVAKWPATERSET